MEKSSQDRLESKLGGLEEWGGGGRLGTRGLEETGAI